MSPRAVYRRLHLRQLDVRVRRGEPGTRLKGSKLTSLSRWDDEHDEIDEIDEIDENNEINKTNEINDIDEIDEIDEFDAID